MKKITIGEDFAFELREEVDQVQVGVEKCIYWKNGEACPQDIICFMPIGAM